MLRAIFEGAILAAAPRLTELLIQHLTLRWCESLDGVRRRLLDFERRGLNEIALALHGDPSKAKSGSWASGRSRRREGRGLNEGGRSRREDPVQRPYPARPP